VGISFFINIHYLNSNLFKYLGAFAAYVFEQFISKVMRLFKK
jgi:hypothetical protein